MDRIGEVRRDHPPSSWRAGEFIRDEQTLELSRDWDDPTATFLVGVWRDAVRMTPLPAEQSDGDHRAVGFRLAVSP